MSLEDTQINGSCIIFISSVQCLKKVCVPKEQYLQSAYTNIQAHERKNSYSLTTHFDVMDVNNKLQNNIFMISATCVPKESNLVNAYTDKTGQCEQHYSHITHITAVLQKVTITQVLRMGRAKLCWTQTHQKKTQMQDIFQ